MDSQRVQSPNSWRRRASSFERALALDPGNLDALVGSAAVDTVVAVSYLVDDRSARLASAEAALARSLSLAPDHALAHEGIGRVQIYTNRAAQGIAECERALLLDRNLATAHATIGLGKLMAGRPEETEAHVSEALRLSPRDNRRLSAWMTNSLAPPRLHVGKLTQRQSAGWDDPSKPIEIMRYRNSTSAPSWPCSDGPRKPALRLRPALRSIRRSPFPAFAPAWGATTRLTSPSANASMTACARRECRSDERHPENRGDPGLRRGRLLPARRRGRGSHPVAAPGPAQRSDRSRHRRASWAHRQADRRRRLVEFRSVVDAVRLRDRSAEPG